MGSGRGLIPTSAEKGPRDTGAPCPPLPDLSFLVSVVLLLLELHFRIKEMKVKRKKTERDILI